MVPVEVHRLFQKDLNMVFSSFARHAGFEEPVPHRDAGASRFYAGSRLQFIPHIVRGRDDKRNE